LIAAAPRPYRQPVKFVRAQGRTAEKNRRFDRNEERALSPD